MAAGEERKSNQNLASFTMLLDPLYCTNFYIICTITSRWNWTISLRAVKFEHPHDGVCSIHISEWLAVLTAYGKNSSFRCQMVLCTAWYIKSCIETVHPLVKNDNWLLMKSRVGRVDRGHKFGPGDFPQATAAAVNVKMDSLIIRPKIARTTFVWSMIPQLG